MLDCYHKQGMLKQQSRYLNPLVITMPFSFLSNLIRAVIVFKNKEKRKKRKEITQ